MKCKICHSEANQYAEKKVLGKYQVSYFQCTHCLFIQTEDPYWLDEAYNNPITHLDIGLVYRNETLAPIVSTIINFFFNNEKQFIDYGGGYGLFVRMMRDRGFDFYRQDLFCDNIFARNFDVTDLQKNTQFELLTAFEVFEHLPDPLSEMEKMLQYSDNILFTTELQPTSISKLNDWWYFSPETGQHISFYTKKTLNHLAEKFNLHFLSYLNLHLLTKANKNSFFYKIAFRKIFQMIINRLYNNRSLLQADFNKVKHLPNH